jgi:hypothetical protein
LSNSKAFTKKNISNPISKVYVIRIRFLSVVFFFVGGIFALAQRDIYYEIEATLDSTGRKLNVVQTISFERLSGLSLDTLYLNDWSHSYSSTKSPLAQRFVEEYDRSFFLSNEKKLGRTEISSIRLYGQPLEWNRSKDQIDIIEIPMPRHTISQQRIRLDMTYEVTLPNAKFTGYGSDEEGQVLLRYWYIALSPFFEGEWRNYSHLNLEDWSIQAAEYRLKLLASSPDWQVVSNLTLNQKKGAAHYFSGKNKREVVIHLDKQKKFETFKLQSDRLLVTDLFAKSKSDTLKQKTIERVDRFVTEIFDHTGDNKLLIPEIIYTKNPFFGLNDLPKFLAPFQDDFLNEISFLKSYLHFYLTYNLSMDLRRDHWIFGGLQTYLILKYIETYYPKEKLLGRLGQFKLMKAYTLAETDFNESFWMYYELMERANLQQSDLIPKDQLVKFNEKIGSPYHVGVGFRYLEHYLGKETLNRFLRALFDPNEDRSNPLKLLEKYSQRDIAWFGNFYLKERLPVDINIKKVKKSQDSLKIKITKLFDDNIPFVLAQVKNDSILSQQWVENLGKEAEFQVKNLNPDYLTVNPEIRLPESNKLNNWRYIKNFMNIKPVQFNFFRDYESPKRHQIFYNPQVNFNLYDGIVLGSRFYDKSLLTQKFLFEITPEYSTKQENMVGRMKFSYLFNNPEQSNYLTYLSFYGSSYHYFDELRYQVITPGINLYFRTDDLRSNKRQALGLFYYNVRRDNPPNQITSPNYELLNLRYFFANQGALKHTTFETNLQVSKKFSKIDATFDFRRLLSNGSQFSFRFFAGKFIYHNQRETQFFDFNLNRPQDYLFRYNYLGRSENSGFFSQQIVMAEGGFKSVHSPATANDFLLSTNITQGIWKWLELYADLALLKNYGQNEHLFFGSGIRFNLIPDYMEIYLPLYSDHGAEYNDAFYASKIRFVLTLNPRKLMQLFSRKWF